MSMFAQNTLERVRFGMAKVIRCNGKIVLNGKYMIELLQSAFKHLINDNPEGVLFYLISSIVMMILMVRNNKEFMRGLKGNNNLFEAPEIVTYIWVWLFPQIILAVLFLRYEPQDWFWLFMGVCLLFSLAGRDGIQMLFNWRGSKTIEKQSTTETESSKETIEK